MLFMKLNFYGEINHKDGMNFNKKIVGKYFIYFNQLKF